jgi:hypothetical protein
MNHDFAYGARQEFLRPRLGWLALCFLAAAILIALNTEVFGAPWIELSHPICPSGWSIAQRYDVRDKNGQIIVSKDHWIKVNGQAVRTGWHRTCLTPRAPTILSK